MRGNNEHLLCLREIRRGCKPHHLYAHRGAGQYALQTEAAALKADLAKTSAMLGSLATRLDSLEKKVIALQSPSTDPSLIDLKTRLSMVEGKLLMLDSQQQAIYSNAVNAVNTKLAQLPFQYATKGDVLLLQARLDDLEAKIK